MKLLLTKVFCSITIIFTLLVLFVLYSPYDKSFAYHYLDQDGKQASWIYDRIVNKLPIDIAVIGSSYTLNGVNDSLVENILGRNGLNCNVANLALSWTGRNFHYILTQDLIKHQL